MNPAGLTAQTARDFEERFAVHWPRVLQEWAEDGVDAFWLIAHASYLLRTDGVRWGVDPTLRTPQQMDFMQEHAARDLAPLSFVLVTHFHGDHFDPRFCEQLSGISALWIVPDFVSDAHRALITAAHQNVRFVSAGDELSVKGHTIRVLSGHHYDDGGAKGVPACAYAVRTPSGKLLSFPGDVRDFRTCASVDCPQPDALFGHVWLGRGRGQLPYAETFLAPYCDYLARAQARHVYLAHLNDFGRPASEMWDEAHALAVAEGLRMRQPGVQITIPRLGCMQAL